METIGRDLAEMQRVPLAPAHVAALRAAGATVRPCTEQRRMSSTFEPTQFMGEIALLYGGHWSMPMRAARDTVALFVPRTDQLRLMSEIPEMSDIIITVLAARRRRQLDHQDGSCQSNANPSLPDALGSLTLAA